MILEIKKVSKWYGKASALRDVALRVRAAERVVILGPSGCGKTTLLRLVAGFLTPDKGRILVDGVVVAEADRSLVEPEDRRVGMVFQDLALWPHMTVYGNLEFGLKAQRVPAGERRRRIGEMLRKVEMSPFEDARPGELSGGQQQRVALARALVLQPKILLLDEPLSNLDYDLNLLLRKEILKLQKDLNITMLYVTHDRDEAFALATRIIVMAHGEIRREGTPGDISAYLQGLCSQNETQTRT